MYWNGSYAISLEIVIYVLFTCNRSARETTPVHLIMRSDVLRPPRSITKRTFSTEANPRTEQPTIPISPEFEEYFAKHEAEQQREFMEKYVLLI